MEREIWIVTKRGDVKPRNATSETEQLAWMTEDVTLQFNTYQEAQSYLREMVYGLATSSNNIFDGNGGIHGLDSYFKEIQSWLDEHGSVNKHRKFYGIICEQPDYSYMGGDYRQAKRIPELIKSFLLGEGIPREGFPRFRWTDWTIAVDSTPNSLKVLYAAPTPPLDGYNPNVEIRGFTKNNLEEEHVLHIHNELGQNTEFVGSLDVRLWKTTECNVAGDIENLSERLDKGYEMGVGFGPGRKIPGVLAVDSVRVETNGTFIPDDFPCEEQVACYRDFVKHVADTATRKGFVVDRRYWVPTTFRPASKVREEYGDRECSTIEKIMWSTKHSTHGNSRVHCYLLSGNSTMADFEIDIALSTGLAGSDKSPFVVRYHRDETHCSTADDAIDALSRTLDLMLEKKNDPSDSARPTRAIKLEVSLWEERPSTP